MKIVYIIDSLRLHGTQRFLCHLVGGLARRGMEQSVICLNDAADAGVLDALKQRGCTVHRLGKKKVLFGLGVFPVAKLLTQQAPDLVLTLLPVADVLGRLAAFKAKIPRVFSSIRARNIDKPSWMRWVDRRTAPRLEKVVFNSKEVIAFSCAEEGVAPEQALTIPNGVPDLYPVAQAARPAKRRSLSLDDNAFLIGIIGRLYPQKNVKLFIRALETLPSAMPWAAVILGDGPERDELELLARSAGLVDRIRFCGAQDDVVPWLGALDLLVHTAEFEGMPNALLEAMSAGVPVIASAVDGNRELITHEKTGWLVAPGDADEFAKTMQFVAAHADLRKEVAAAACQHIQTHYSIDAMVDAYASLFHLPPRAPTSL